MQSIRLLLACGSTAHALLTSAPARMSAPRAAAVRMDFGDSFYAGFGAWAAEYPQADRDAYPELFKLPKDCYEVILEKPLGIAFEENDDGGVVVDYLVEGGNADKDGTIKPGDVLLATTAAMSIGPKFERKLIPSRYLDFDTIMGAIASNAPKYHKKRLNDVILQFARPGAPYDNDGDPYEGGARGINDYVKSLEFPPDSPWRSNRG